MKNPLIAFVVALSLTASPVMAQSFDMGSLTPTLDFPEPNPEPVTQDRTGIDK
ncbi:hypothetical protein [Roseovarius aestuarii]|uniref:Uncharacterized protein n=1 Tax=Roseovarius aestuarii TaxID=475083 RepID=A0A1X7BQ90_9RHOB|nr:hypothetical protein [Roseovarius aestuarii]SMC11369.1 hypothetical protein ROA7745_01181 [Roseovarius aestuarii]